MSFLPFFPNLDVQDINEVQKRARRYATAVILLVGVGLLYMAVSVVLIFSLFHANDELCDARQTARTGLREEIYDLGNEDGIWDANDQHDLDVRFPVKVSGC